MAIHPKSTVKIVCISSIFSNGLISINYQICSEIYIPFVSDHKYLLQQQFKKVTAYMADQYSTIKIICKNIWVQKIYYENLINKKFKISEVE